MHKIVKVDNPIYLSVEEMADKFWDNWLLISNSFGNSGIVRYYCYGNTQELTDKIMELEKDSDTYGECLLRYIGPGRGDWLGRLS